MASSKRFLSSEHYRQMLVRDGQRRYQEWHSQFVNYQKRFLRELATERLAWVETQPSLPSVSAHPSTQTAEATVLPTAQSSTPELPVDAPGIQEPDNSPTVSTVTPILGSPSQDQADAIVAYLSPRLSGARLADIEKELGLSRVETVDTLQWLTEQGKVIQMGRNYLINPEAE